MFGRGVYGVLAVFIVLLFISSALSPVTSCIILKKRTIRVAIIRQYWDLLDVRIGNKSTIDHKKCLRDAESRYGVKFKVYEFWDGWDGGDVQNGRLEKLGIDVIIAPGGFGGWHTPERYREELKRFVRNGGGFYGICGDSTFGSMGVKNLPKTYGHLIKRLLGFKELSPMLGLANVYTDASVFKDMVGHPWRFTKLDLAVCLTQLVVSRAPVYFLQTSEPIQKPYFRKTLRMMLGNAPLVSGSKLKGFFMPDVIDLAVFLGSDKPYDKSMRWKKAIVATTYGEGRVILSAPHPELTVGKDKAHDIFIRNLLWVARALPNT